LLRARRTNFPETGRMQKQRPRKPLSGRYRRIMSTFAERLKHARERAGFESAEVFAHAADWHPHRYRKYERGEVEPNFDTLTRICELLGCTPNDLLPEAARGGKKGDRKPKIETGAAA
jgi:ribosome-binding protein aMBF1 (putative translation factor)